MKSQQQKDSESFAICFVLVVVLSSIAFIIGVKAGRSHEIKSDIARLQQEKAELDKQIDSIRSSMYLDSLSVIPAERSVPQPQGVQE